MTSRAIIWLTWLLPLHSWAKPQKPTKNLINKICEIDLLTYWPATIWQILNTARMQSPETEASWICWNHFGGTYFRWVLAIWNHCALLSRQRAPNAAFYGTHSGHSADFFFLLIHYLQNLFFLLDTVQILFSLFKKKRFCYL